MEQDMYVPASSWFIAISLVVALILNFLQLPERIAFLRPDFVALLIAYWSINHPERMSMSVAFGMGLMMDVGNVSILGQHALAYCVAMYLTIVFGRRLRLFSALQQAPQIGLVLFIMQVVIVLIAVSTGASLVDWQFFLAAVSGSIVWVPMSLLLTLLLQPKPDPDAL
ncbi:rod shape-determining protein MreD [Nitrosomonas sp.]|uniref:rod shape-determining protein MreD n=1 Tax=Nitrosomonas sp. TaxID=42353 RepID=UPI0025ED38A5|nr:rod shape-determining protein MreD [Nitrosomonas sp.]